MFVGRIKELELLSNNFNNKATATLIYGKRRIGKTTLIKKAMENSNNKNIYYECIKSSLSENLDLFIDTLVEFGVLNRDMSFKTFDALFAYLNTLNDTFNIAIDEYPYLKCFEKSEYVDSVFQKIIDNQLNNINLVLSGSHIGMMSNLTKQNNSLYGRFTSQIILDDLNYLEASEFYHNKSIHDKIALYSIFGGSPYVLDKIDENLSIKDNIVNLLLNKLSMIYSYASELITSDITFVEQAKRIFSCIGNSRIKYSELQNKLKMESNGLLSKQLKVLIEMKFIKKNYPINKLNDDKKATYEISDNLLRFYYTYIYKSRNILEIIGPDIFYDRYIEKSITTFISYRFEDIVKEFFRLNNDGTILNIGSYYYDDPRNKRNGEFDVALEKEDGYVICEVKYFKNPVSKDIVNEEKRQVALINEIKIVDLIFASSSGFTFKETNYITGQDIYQNSK